MVDLGIILNENILRHLETAPAGQTKLKTVYLATSEVSGAIITAVSTTIISFLPVFTLQAAEGKLFGPLAYTKTFALISAVIFTLLIMPAFSHWIFFHQKIKRSYRALPELCLTHLGSHHRIYSLVLGRLVAFRLWFGAYRRIPLS